MVRRGMYGSVYVESEVFDKITNYLISGSTNNTKFLCANELEEKYLNSFGIETDVICDWYEIKRVK